MNTKLKRWSLALLMLTLVVGLTACSSSDNSAATATPSPTTAATAADTAEPAPAEAAGKVYVTVAARYVDDAKLEAFAALLREKVDGEIIVQSVITGDPDADPMSTVAGMAKIGGLFASHEVDLFICDTESAQRNGGSDPELYATLESTFTQAQLDAFTAEPISIYLTDDEGNKTEEATAPCGVSLSKNETLTTTLGLSDLNMILINGADNADLAKVIFEVLATME